MLLLKHAVDVLLVTLNYFSDLEIASSCLFLELAKNNLPNFVTRYQQTVLQSSRAEVLGNAF